MRTKIYSLILMVLFTLTAATAWSRNVTIKTDTETGESYINLPTTGLDVLTIPDDVMEFKIYSDGGKNGSYSYNADGYLQIVLPEGRTLMLNGYVYTSNSRDSECFAVYDGTTESPKLVDSLKTYLYGSARQVYSMVGSNNIMTLYFGSRNSSGYSGPNLTATVQLPEHTVSVTSSVTGGTAQIDKTQAAFGEKITLTATPETNYRLSGATFVDGNGNAISLKADVSWDSNVLTFAMPNSSVTVTPTFTQEYTAGGGMYVNMPRFGTKTLVVPDGVASFKVYDEGGQYGDYSNVTKGYLTITAPEGCRLSMTGKINTGNNGMSAKLTVLDGDASATDILLNEEFGTNRDIGTLRSTGKEITLYFHQNYDQSKSGLDLTVEIISPKSVSVASSDGGVAQSNSNQVFPGETVTITAVPETGFMLSGISVLDASQNPVKGGVVYDWNANTASFVMPESDITVIPVFSSAKTSEAGLEVNMPLTGKTVINVPTGVSSFKVYDDGGSAANYSDGATGYLEINAQNGYVIQLNGTLNAESARYDNLTIYDGTSESTEMFLNATGCATNNCTFTVGPFFSTGNTLTIYFKSDVSQNYAGLDLTVKVFNPTIAHSISLSDGVTNGSVTFDPQTATMGTPISLTVSPDAGYVLTSLDIRADGSDLIDNDISWYNFQGATFTMPYGDVVIEPSFTNTLTAEDDLHIDMPTTGVVTATIPSDVVSFKIYDDGGKNGTYKNNSNGSLVLTAPDNYLMVVTGTIYTYSGDDYLIIYDGIGTSSEKLFDQQNITNIGTIVSSGNNLRMEFHSNASYVASGLNLTVKLINKTLAHSITITDVTGGLVTSEPENATFGLPVALTVSPADGYYLNSLDVTADGAAVPVEGGLWYASNTASFSMPYADVVVTPAFVNAVTAEGGLYINMPVSGTTTATIPNEVVSFKVYDDGGSSARYSNNANGYLVLNAPSGYIMKITGRIGAGDSQDYLTVFDGSSTTSAMLYERNQGSANSIGTLVSSSNTVMLYFYSDAAANGTGLDLTVSLLDATVKHNVEVSGTISGGFITIDPSSATLGETVSLTANPSEGYYLTAINAVDDEGRSVTITGGSWTTGNKASFTMPYANVNVAPVFSNDFDGQFVFVPSSGSENVEVVAGTTFKVYDGGGKESNYVGNSSGYLYLKAPDGYALQVTGTVTTDASGEDYLTIYDGNSENAPELLSRKASQSLGKAVDIGVQTSSGNALTLYFHSNDQYEFAGLDLTVSVAPPKAVSVSLVQGGTVSCAASAVVNQMVTLTAVPNEGYVLDGFVAYSNGNAVNVNFKKWDNTATFVMPNDAVTITPIFSAANDLSVNMPVSGVDTIIVPAGVKSLKVYDDGGSDANYSNGANGYLVLTAPAGYLLRVSGSLTAEGTKTDNLSIYDGNNSAILLNAFAGTSNGVAADVGTVWSLSNTIKLFFKSDNTVNFSGLDLTVTIEDPSVAYNVTINDAEGGSVAANYVSASAGTSVILVATPETGHVLSGVSVVDAAGNDVAVAGGKWYSGDSAIFVMPSSDVTVTPVFSSSLSADDGLYVVMPVSGTLLVRVPENVTSFKIYDDGGKDGLYSNNADGYLELRASEKFGLRVSSVALDIDNSDNLEYDAGDGTWKAFSNSGSSKYNSIKLHFRSDVSRNSNGFELTAMQEPLNPVTILSVDGGTVTSNKAYARAGSIITLTATPEGGKLLKSLTAEANNNHVTVYWSWYGEDNNSAYFVMPDYAVTVTPTFAGPLTADDIYVYMPSSETRVAHIPTGVVSFKVYDNGGESSPYSAGVDGYLELNAPEGCVLRVTGSIATEENYDKLTIYDGSTSAGKLINNTSGSVDDINVLSSGKTITLYFYSDNNVNRYDGLDLTVSVINNAADYAIELSPFSNGTVSGYPNAAKAGSTISLTATPDADYMFNGVLVKDAWGNVVKAAGGMSWLDNVASFIMPASNVSVTPVFLNEASADDGLYVNMPATGARTIQIPDGVSSFKIYDDGGKDGDYSNDADGTIELIAPDGYLLKVTGSVTMVSSGDDMIYVYDGDLTNAKLAAWGRPRTLNFLSSGKSAVITLSSDATATNSGLDLTVALLRASEPHNISISEVSGGSVSVENTSVAYGTEVVLTPHPNPEYILTNVNIVDSDGRKVPIAKGAWYSKDPISFVMPYSDVTVSPVFVKNPGTTDGLFINLPKEGTISAEIPAGVESFKVYDDGGQSGMYSHGASGAVELRAAMGYVMRVTGTRKTNTYDYPIIYDGINTSVKLYEDVSEQSGSRNVGPVVSSDSTMTIYFYSNGTDNDEGIDFTVDVIKLSEEHSIVLSDGVSGGTVDIVPSSAAFGTPVTLTAAPANGKTLKEIVATDYYGESVEISGNCYFGGSCQFDMPSSDVSLTPVFVDEVSADDGVYINMPATGSVSVNVPPEVRSFKVYDDGGKYGKYGVNVDGYLNLVAPDDGYIIQVTGSVLTYGRTASLTIFDGDAPASVKLLDAISGKRGDIGTIVSSGNTLTLYFTSNSWVYTYAGIDLTVTLIEKSSMHVVQTSEISNGSVTINPSSAVYGTLVEMTMTPAEGYNLSKTSVVDESGEDVPVTGGWWYSGNTAVTFDMPNSDVVVTPEFSNNLENLYVNMPKNGTKIAQIPAAVTSFKVYDDGGPDRDYSDKANGNLLLVAPEGFVLEVTGSMKANKYNNLFIYDGDTSTTLLLYENVYGTTNSIGTWMSSSNLMTIRFEGDLSGQTKEGLDFTVTLVPSSERHVVTVNAAANGSMESDKDNAVVGEVVTLTASPDAGYYLSDDLTIVGCNDDTLVYSGGWFTEGRVSFVMPSCDVTVLPAFAGEYFVKVPFAGKRSIAVPQGITSFKVYDNGGNAGNYRARSNGYLQVVVPEDYVLRVTGNMRTASYDVLSIYNGNETAPLLVDALSAIHDIDVTSSENILLFYFYDDGNLFESSGFDLTVTLLSKEAKHVVALDAMVSGGTVAINPELAAVMDTVELVAMPDEGYFLAGIDAIDENDDTLVVTDGWWFIGDKARFIMPYADVTVIPHFVSGSMTDDARYINMPVSGKKIVNVPVGTAPFHVYDDGGADNNYSNNSEGFLVMQAPAGYEFEVSGNIAIPLYDPDYLNIYDGDSTLICQVKSDFGPERSLGGVMMLNFHSNYSANAAGLDLTVSLVDASAAQLVTVYEDGEINMPKRGTIEAVIPDNVTSFHVYDDGGSAGNYSNSDNGYLVLTAPNGKVLQLSGSVETYDSRDKLTIYDGDSLASTKLLSKESGTKEIDFLASSGRMMTLYFVSDGSSSKSGLDFEVKVVDATIPYTVTVSSVENGSMEVVGEKQFYVGDTVTLVANPASGYLFGNISVDAGGNYVDVIQEMSLAEYGTVKFAMPASDVTVLPYFVTSLTFDDGVFVATPVTGRKEVNIPPGVNSFKIYDDGGKDTLASKNVMSQLVLRAPQGYAFTLHGSATVSTRYICTGSTYCTNYLNVRNGDASDMSTTSIHYARSTSTFAEKTSSGNVITVEYHTNSETQGDDFELTAVLTYIGLNYSVTFDVESLDNVGDYYVIGKGTLWRAYNTAMSVNYVRNSGDLLHLYGKDVNGDFYRYAWTPTENDNSLATNVLNAQVVSVATAGATDQTSFTMYPIQIQTPAGVDAAEIRVEAYEGGTLLTDAADFHGKVVLSQTWGEKTFSQTSVIKAPVGYDNYQSLTVPSPVGEDDTLVFDVKFDAEPGYSMSFGGFTTPWNDGGVIQEAPPENQGWGYNADNKTLKILPSYMTNMVLKVNYVSLHYNVAFDRPSPESQVFVANRFNGTVPEMDWLENESNKTIGDMDLPAVYNANGCRVGWKAKARGDGPRTHVGLDDEAAYMTAIEDDANAQNELELDILHPLCEDINNGTGPTHLQTLQIEDGLGRLVLIQKIGEGSASQKTIVSHEFVNNELSVPQHIDTKQGEAGVSMIVVAIPEPGYTLKQLSYDMTMNDNSLSILTTDSATVNVDQDITWHVTFSNFETVYLAYDLSLSGEDSSKVWIPANATLNEGIEVLGDGFAHEMWKPYREDVCFDGWTKDPDDVSAPIFTEVDEMNSGEFSKNPTMPTQLYAVYGRACSQPSTNTIYSRYFEDMNNPSSYSEIFKDTLVVTQKLENHTFTHKGTRLSFGVNANGYLMAFSILPEHGHELESETPQVSENVNGSLVAYAANTESVYHIGTNASSSEFYVGFKDLTTYKVVLSANAGGAAVFYGENWSTSAALRIGGSLPDGRLFRTDACFSGWSFDPEEIAEPNFDNNNRLNTLGVSLLQQRSDRLAMGLNVDTLYAKWNTANLNCWTRVEALTLANDVSKNAVVSMYQKVDGADVKILEIGDGVAYVPYGNTVSHNGSNYTDDVIFSKIDVAALPGASLSESYQLSYVKASDPNVTQHEITGSNVVFDDDIEFRLQGLVRNSYDVVYHENVDNENVFYGENWNANVTIYTDDELSRDLFRVGACVAGWTFEDETNGTVYTSANATFIDQYLTRKSVGKSTDLYAVWSTDATNCVIPIRSVTASLSDDLKEKAKIELVQTVEGQPKVVAIIDDAGASIPLMKAEVSDEYGHFSGIRVVPDTGYVLDNTVAVSYKVGNAAPVEISGDWFLTENSVIMGAVLPVSYAFDFDVNVNNANVFYPTDWSENGTYNLDDDASARIFPVVYRTEKCLVGWGFSKDASRSESFQKFESSFINAFDSVTAANGAEPTTLYAVWNECSQILYTVSLNDVAEGTLVLSRGGKTYDVPATGFQVPEAGLEFGVSFIPNLGYKLADDGVFNVVDNTGAIVAALTNNSLVVDGDKIVDAPVVTLENTFAFDVNADGAVLFYGNDWVKSAMYSLDGANNAFPVGVYRVGSCLKGWSLNTDAERSYRNFDTDFLTDVEATKTAGLPVDKLYAVWGDCEIAQTLVTLTNADTAAGTFTLTRNVSNTPASYVVTGEGITVPADEALAFEVAYVANTGYTYDATAGVSAVDANDTPVEINAGVLTVATSLTLSAAVSADTYTFALAENAGDANVFYAGTPVTTVSMQVTGSAEEKTLPTNLYRSDACLAGFAFAADAVTGFTKLDDDFIAAYEAEVAAGNAPETLYAVWNRYCLQILYNITSADSTKGRLVLTQGDRSFEVGRAGLQVPSVDGGLVFTAEFTPFAGYAYDVQQGLEATNASGSYDALENGAITVTRTVTVRAASLAASEYNLVFDVNSGDATVFYGNEWRAGDVQAQFSFANPGRFPTNLYRTDSCVVGWTLSLDEEAGVFQGFNDAFVDSVTARATFDGKLYAKWGACDVVKNATVAQVSSNAGTLVLTQTDASGNVLNTTAVGADAVTLPLGNDDVSFNVSFTVGEGAGYVLDPDDYFYTVSSNGNNIQALVDGQLAFSGNTSLRAPVVSSSYAVSFNENAGDATLFYGDEWVASKEYTIGATAVPFPTGLYRVGSCLKGWALNASADTYYTQFDIPFMTVVESAKKSGLPTGTLYAVWGECEVAQTVASVENDNVDAGSFTLSRTVDGKKVDYDVAGSALMVPVPAEGSLTFAAAFTPNNGYAFNETAGISAIVDGETTALTGNAVTVSGNMKLAAAITATDYVFAIDVNAGSANVFYAGTPVTSVAMNVTGNATEKALPTNIYRSEACLDGFAFSAGAVKGFKKLDDDFIAAYEAEVTAGNTPDTLYAVWDRYCLQTLYNVTSGDLGKGSLVLSQGENTFTVGSNGLTVPAVDGGLTFAVEFTPATGYAYDTQKGLEATDALGNSVALEGGYVTVTKTISVGAVSLKASTFDIVFSENAGDATVYYGNAWRAGTMQTSFSLSNAGAFPADIYRTDACFKGWTIVKDNAEAAAFSAFGAEFIAAAGESFSDTLYAKWGACDVANNATVSQVTAYAGKLVLTQTDAAGNVLNTTEVDSEAVSLPLGNDDISFNVSFVVGEGFVLDPDGYFYTVSSNGNNVMALVDGKLSFSGNTKLRAPVVSDTYAVSFNENAGNATLFYGDGWVTNKVYVIEDQAQPFPTALYRAGSCLKGWAINADAETYYTQFDIAFMTEVETAKKAGLPTAILYAVWGECETEQVIASVTHNNGETGGFTLTRSVANKVMTYELADGALAVPVPAEGALKFDVAFAVNAGYAFDGDITASVGGAAATPLTGTEIAVSGDVILEAAVTATEYKFAIDMNAGDADLFYVGDAVTQVTLHVTDNAAAKTLPTNVYRRDACLDGFAFAEDATVGYRQLDAAFVAAYESVSGEKPATLYAVWDTDCRQVLYTVTNADSSRGTLTLAQGSRTFNVGPGGFKVPAVEGGLAFVAEFKPATGYQYSAVDGLVAYSVTGQSIGKLENGAVTVAESMRLKAANLKPSAIEIAFAENAGDAKVFYGDAWRAGAFQTTFSLENAGAFPMDIYRTDSCLAGWTLTKGDGAGIFQEFTANLVDSLEAMVQFDGTLYAKWGACIDENNATVSQVSSAAGRMTLTQTDAAGNVLNATVVDADAVTLPLGNGDVTFDVSFAVREGYSLAQNGYFYTVDARGNNVAALVGGKLALSGNTVLRAPILPDTYAITFNTNAGDANVFYGAGWVSEGQFSMDLDEVARTYPTEVYRVGYSLVGWSLTPMAAGATLVAGANGGYEGVYKLYDEAFSAVVKAAGNTAVTLYAVWSSAPDQRTYRVTLADAEAGHITAKQTVGSTVASFVVGAEGLEVPAVTEGLAFNIEATLNEGYFADGNALYLVNSDNSRIGPVENNLLVVDSDKIVEIPVQTDGVQFVFNENTNARVFYEDGWKNVGYFALNGNTEFPKEILRTEGVLLGWAISRNSSKYYTSYDGEFVADLQSYKKLGIPTDTLFAVWRTYGLFTNVNVTNDNLKNGLFYISQTVNGVETDPIEVSAGGIQIPYSEKGLTFNVKFETKPGYYLNAEDAIASVDASGKPLGRATNGGTLVFKSPADVTLNATIAANRYKFVFDVNGGDANVFYATDWTSSAEMSLDDASLVFPTNIYRADACLEGWSVDSTAETGFTKLTSEFIETLDRTKNVNTLYAVWRECEVETYTVTFANTNVGSLVLSQDVEGVMVTFDVAEAGLEVPVVPEGLRFRAAYTLKAGYSGNTDTLFVVDDISGVMTTLADNSLTVDDNITLAIPTQGRAFTLVFDVNRKGSLFYGNDWVDSNTYILTDKKSAIPLPAYVYTSDRCMVGWSLSKSDTVSYLKFNNDLAAALLEQDPLGMVFTLYAVWGKGKACDEAYDRITLASDHGAVTLMEMPRGESTEYIVHEFVNDGTMILPKTINGNNIRVLSKADSSYILDSLVMTREDSEGEREVYYEGDALVYNLAGAKFQAFFGKSNRTEVAFVDPYIKKTGNAIRFEFSTSNYEITRNVSARVRLETEDGELVSEESIADSIVPPYNGSWDKFPLAAGKYVLKATIGDERESDEFVGEFEVVAEIASASEDSWQMISIGNLDKDAMVWDADPKFFWWDEASASGDYWQYKEYDPKKDSIVATRGYWYSSLEGRSLVLKPEAEIEIADKVEWKLDSVNSGWNLVANPYGFALDLYGDHPAEKVDVTEESSISFWRWNTVAGRYDPATTLEPYEAVWVRVHGPVDWTIPVVPDFAKDDTSDSEEEMLAQDSANVELRSLNKAMRLVKANSKNDWRIQAVLSDASGKKDSWNMLGVSSRPFIAEEPPEGMGNHVNLSVLDGNRRLAKSVKAPADEQEWAISLSASSERYGDLSFKGIDALNAIGLKVFVMLDGKTTEMHDGESLKVLLKSSASKATVRVAKSAKVVADLHIDGLRSVQAGSYLNVSFVASADLAGTRTIVEVLNMDGKVVSSRSAKTLAGTNMLALDAPRGGMYMLRVRAGSQMKAGRIIVK